MKISVVGLGYVGLPTALMFAMHGHQVAGCDSNAQLMAALQDGQFDSVEPGLTALYQQALKTGRITFAERPADDADAYLLALPTPKNRDGSADLLAIRAVAEQIRPLVRAGTLIILESTVPPGTTDGLAAWIGNPAALYAHVPERVLPGNLIAELVHNPRIIGGVTPQAARLCRAVYQTFVQGDLTITDAKTAEFAKLMENTYRDVNLALANEFARVGHRLGVSARRAIALANQHPRVNILSPGLGVGGHCIAVDPWFIVHEAPAQTALIRTARQVNDSQPEFVVDLIKEQWGTRLTGCRVAVLGLSYKADVSDTRESPSAQLIDYLESQGAQVRVSDPGVRGIATRTSEPLPALFEWADALVFATGHRQYRNLEPSLIRRVRKGALVIDAPGVLDAARWSSLGIRVNVVGDPLVADSVTALGSEA